MYITYVYTQIYKCINVYNTQVWENIHLRFD